LRKIEDRFGDDVVVIGVHSGKYIAERETARIRDATLRYDIAHAIVNDRQFRVWRSYAVRAWPTLVVIDRNGYVVGAHAGEFTADVLEPALKRLVAMATDHATSPAPHIEIEQPGIEPTMLRYPGKVAVRDRRIAISDTGNHRVIVGELENATRMRITRVVRELEASGEAGSVRGFHSPQGLAFSGNTLYIADAEQHIVAAVDLVTGGARVLAGTGSQMRTRSDRDKGALSSPWDLTVADGTIYVAMAGVHQLWAIDATTGRSRLHCGAGGEDIADGPLADALLAQPMGIASDDSRLYFADAESSAVRWADIAERPGAQVKTIVGTGLFDFGDVDGVGDKVRMQHQQGVSVRGTEVLVADTYNDALKWVDIETRKARTWLRGLHEPGGVATAEHHAYIADTNAHRVMVADYRTDTPTVLEIVS